MQIIFGFAALGFLIGTMMALTEEKIVGTVLTLLFAFVGGSILTFLHKMSADERRVAGVSIIALSIACTIGIYSNLLLLKYHVLSASGSNEKLLRSDAASCAGAIDRLKSQGMPLEDAYQRLYIAATTGQCNLEKNQEAERAR